MEIKIAFTFGNTTMLDAIGQWLSASLACKFNGGWRAVPHKVQISFNESYWISCSTVGAWGVEEYSPEYNDCRIYTITVDDYNGRNMQEAAFLRIGKVSETVTEVSALLLYICKAEDVINSISSIIDLENLVKELENGN